MNVRQARQTPKSEMPVIRSTPVRAFWKLRLEPIDADRAEGHVQIRVDSPDRDERKRAINMPCIVLVDMLMIAGRGEANETRKDEDEHVHHSVDLSLPALPFNVMEFFIDLRRQIEAQWKDMRRRMKGMPLEAQGIATVRFKHELTPEEAMQMHLMKHDEEKNDGEAKPNCGSVRQLRQTFKGAF